MPSPRSDGRRTRCPVCLHVVSTGTLRMHVASARCMATVTRERLTLTAEQQGLITQVLTLDEKIAAMVKAAKEAQRAGS